MAAFSSGDAGLAGFKLIRDDFKSVGLWAGAYLAYTLILSALGMVLLGPSMEEFVAAAAAGGQLPPEQAVALTQRVAPYYVVSMLVGLVFTSMMQTAIYRSMLKPADGVLGHFKLGVDEFHQVLINIVIVVIMMAAYLAAIIVSMIIMIPAMMATPLAGFVVVPLVFIGAPWALIYLAIRLSLAGPQTLAEGKLNLFGTWGLTRKRAGSMFGAYMIASLLMFVAMIIAFTVSVAAIAATVGGGLDGLRGFFNTPQTAMNMFTPAGIAAMIVGVGAGVFALIMTCAPPAYIYRALKPSHAEVFD